MKALRISHLSDHPLPLLRHRFPPLLPPEQSGGPRAAPVDFGQEFNRGFHEGLERGHQEGLQQGLAQGMQQGREQGLELGLSEGERQGRALFEQTLAPLDALARRLEALEVKRLREHKVLIAELVSQVARRVIHAELTLHPQQVLSLADEALRGLKDDTDQLRLFLSPDDCQRLQGLGIEECKGWPLEADPALKTGDCRVETGKAVIESLIEERLETCVGGVRSNLGGDPAARRPS